MLRFVDLTPHYWPDEHPDNPSACAILSTVTDTFLAVDGAHVLDSVDDVREAAGERAPAAKQFVQTMPRP